MSDGPGLAFRADESTHPAQMMQRVTDRTLDLVETARGVMVGLTDGDGITYVAGSGNQGGLIGTHVALGSSLSGVAVRTGEIQRSDDTETDPRVDLEACRRHSVRSLVCVPLRRDQQSIGVLAVNAPTPHAFTDEHVAALARLAGFVGIAVGSARDLQHVSEELVTMERALDTSDDAHSAAERYILSVLDPDQAARRDLASRIRLVLDEPKHLSIVLQPVVDVFVGASIAVEALARFDVGPNQTPDRWFAEAHACGLGVELELLAVQAALENLPLLDRSLLLTLNVGPETAKTPELAALLRTAPLQRLVVELTEHEVVEDYDELISALRPLRRDGLRIAIDDTGSGYSSLAHILKIAPEYIKLDCELTSGIDMDPVRRALATSLVAFAADTGAEIVAEGVENQDELEILRDLGVRYAQGYHLGRPGPISFLHPSRGPLPPISD